MTTIIRFPADPTIFARLTERQRQANIAEEREEAVTDCKRIIDNPRGYTDAQLREVCGFYMTYGDGGVHYLRADEHIAAINKREWQARNCPRQETSLDVFIRHGAAFRIVVIGVALAGLVAWAFAKVVLP